MLPPLAPGADLFVLEGPITAHDLAARTLTGAGVTVYLPVGFLIDVDDAPGGDITLERLIDPVYESRRSIIGGTFKAKGALNLVSGACFRLDPTEAKVELAEHVLVGPLARVDPVRRTFYVGEVAVAMSGDPRFPRELLGAGGQAVTPAALAGFLGTLVEANGYFENGVLRATHVETAAYVAHPVLDTVIVTRAQWGQGHADLEVRGFVTSVPATGAFAPLVELRMAPAGTAGGACAGPITIVLGTSYDPLTNTCTFRYDSPNQAYPVMPAEVCVTSPNGGAFERAVSAGS